MTSPVEAEAGVDQQGVSSSRNITPGAPAALLLVISVQLLQQQPPAVWHCKQTPAAVNSSYQSCYFNMQWPRMATPLQLRQQLLHNNRLQE